MSNNWSSAGNWTTATTGIWADSSTSATNITLTTTSVSGALFDNGTNSWSWQYVPAKEPKPLKQQWLFNKNMLPVEIDNYDDKYAKWRE